MKHGHTSQLSRVLAATSLFTSLLVGAACGAPPSAQIAAAAAHVEGAIIDGFEADQNVFPQAGVLLFVTERFDKSKFGSMMCSGTLIAPDVVLAAAHCDLSLFVNTDAPIDYYFSRSSDVTDFGRESVELPPSTVKVAKMVPHPRFDLYRLGLGLRHGYDVALFYLEEPIDDVEPAKLVTKREAVKLKRGAEVQIVGYGRRHVEDLGDGDSGRKYFGVTKINRIGKYEMQIASGSPSPHKCHGDSGGPTFMVINPGTRRAHMALVGITSHAYDYKDCEHGGVDTRVDPYLRWLHRTMNEACVEGDRPACNGSLFIEED